MFKLITRNKLKWSGVNIRKNTVLQRDILECVRTGENILGKN